MSGKSGKLNLLKEELKKSFVSEPCLYCRTEPGTEQGSKDDVPDILYMMGLCFTRRLKLTDCTLDHCNG